jgi:hypothetical protein
MTHRARGREKFRPDPMEWRAFAAVRNTTTTGPLKGAGAGRRACCYKANYVPASWDPVLRYRMTVDYQYNGMGSKFVKTAFNGGNGFRVTQYS